MSARDHILGAVAARLGARDVNDKTIERRLAQPPAGVIPGRGDGPLERRVRVFTEEATRVGAEVLRLGKPVDLPPFLDRWLDKAGIERRLRRGADPLLDRIDWPTVYGIAPRVGPPRPDDVAGVVVAFAGIAETGTCVLLSGPDNPPALALLPPVLMVLLPVERLLGNYEAAWARLREAGPLPRAVTWVTGPSRTADIEQTLMLGAHGPRRLVVLLMDHADHG